MRFLRFQCQYIFIVFIPVAHAKESLNKRKRDAWYSGKFLVFSMASVCGTRAQVLAPVFMDYGRIHEISGRILATCAR